MNNISNYDRSYLAGLVDGDGSIFIRRARSSIREQFLPVLSIASKHRHFLQCIQNLIGGGNIISERWDKSGETVVRYIYYLTFTCTSAKGVINLIYKYLLISNARASVALDFPKVSRRGFRWYGNKMIQSKEFYQAKNKQKLLYHEMRDTPHFFAMQEMNTNEIFAYSAGFFDAEGHVSICHLNNRLESVIVGFTNKNLEILEFIKETFGIRNKLQKDANDVFRLICTGNAAKDVLRNIKPFLRLKKDRAELAILFPLQENKGCKLSEELINERHIISNKMALLNGRAKAMD